MGSSDTVVVKNELSQSTWYNHYAAEIRGIPTDWWFREKWGYPKVMGIVYETMANTLDDNWGYPKLATEKPSTESKDHNRYQHQRPPPFATHQARSHLPFSNVVQFPVGRPRSGASDGAHGLHGVGLGVPSTVGDV